MSRMMMSRSIITRRGCMTIIMVPVMPVAVTEMSRLMPPMMPARMGIMPLDMRLAVNRAVITSTVSRLSERYCQHGGQDYHGNAKQFAFHDCLLRCIGVHF